MTLCISVAPAAAQARTAAPASEEVRFPSDAGAVLAGTLETPTGFGAGPFPVAVIIAGTGPFARGGFENIRARLLTSGIATFIYDKRGQGRSTGTFVDTIPAMERDVASAVAFLRTHRKVDPRRIALVGMSQGGVAGPLVASRDPVIAAVVILSGPVGPRGELFLNVLRSHLKGNGKNPAQVEQVILAVGAWMEARSASAGDDRVAQLRQASVDAFAAVGFPRAQSEGFITTLDNPVVLSMFEAAPDKTLASIRVPVLVIYGSQDTILAPNLVAAAVAALEDNPDSLVVTVAGMTHELQRAKPDPRAAPVQDSTMPIVTDTLGAWLARRLAASAP